MPEYRSPLALGTETRRGPIGAVGFKDGERFYMMVDARGIVSLMPGDVVEREFPRGTAAESTVADQGRVAKP